MDGWMDGLMSRLVDGWMDGMVDRWMDGNSGLVFVMDTHCALHEVRRGAGVAQSV
jgi:hypothetical protein